MIVIQPKYCINPKGTAVTKRATSALIHMVSAKNKLEYSKVKSTTLKAILFDVFTPLSIAVGVASVCFGQYFSAAMSGVYTLLNGGIAIDYHKKLRTEKEKKKQAENELKESSQELKDIIYNTNFLDIINRSLTKKYGEHYGEIKLPITPDKAMKMAEVAWQLPNGKASPLIFWDELQYEAHVSE